MLTYAEENYLKTIFHLQNETDGDVSTNAISEEIKTKPSSVTDMIKVLAEKKLLNYVKYKGVQLTEEGRASAMKVVRKHRLWETFLVEKLHFKWDEVHDIAEQLEHIHSDVLVDKLDDFLGNPKHDPHGDPIPDADGNLKLQNKKVLAKAPVGVKLICVGVKNSEAEFLQYLSKREINIGTEIQILDKEFDGSVEIQVQDTAFSVSDRVANNLYVRVD